VDTVAVHDPETGDLAVFAVNRGADDLTLNLDLRGLARPHEVSGREHVRIVAGEAANTAEAPDRVLPQRVERPAVDAGRSTVRLAAASWNLIRYTNTPREHLT
jgi:alpha-N-arabinofuranosidase